MIGPTLIDGSRLAPCRSSMTGLHRRSEEPQTQKAASGVRTRPSSDDPHEIVYFKRHRNDDSEEAVPGRAFLREVCPTKVRATMQAVLTQVAAAPPKRFAGGGYWEAMGRKSGVDMTGWFEVRVNGPQRHHYRLFCLLDYDAAGWDKPLLVVVDGRDKPFRTELPIKEYEAVKALETSTGRGIRGR